MTGNATLTNNISRQKRLKRLQNLPSRAHDDVRDESVAALFGLLGRVCSESGLADFEVEVREHMLFDSLLIADKMKVDNAGGKRSREGR